MKNLMVLVVSAFILTGCWFTPMTAVKTISVAKQIGEERIADKMLDRHIRQLCNWPTQGAIRRKWGNNPTMLKYYNTFCEHGL